MKIIYKNKKEEAIKLLKNNGVIAIATDTVYGLCARINSKEAFDKLVKVKGRPKEKAFPIMCANYKEMERLAYIDKQTKKIIETFMPGPLTIIVNKKEDLPSYISEGKESVALRMATSKLLKDIIDGLGEAIFMTSANISGEKEYQNIEEIANKLDIDGIIDSKPTFQEASTILDCRNMSIIRKGPISIKDINKVIKEKAHEG